MYLFRSSYNTCALYSTVHIQQLLYCYQWFGHFVQYKMMYRKTTAVLHNLVLHIYILYLNNIHHVKKNTQRNVHTEQCTNCTLTCFYKQETKTSFPLSDFYRGKKVRKYITQNVHIIKHIILSIEGRKLENTLHRMYTLLSILYFLQREESQKIHYTECTHY